MTIILVLISLIICHYLADFQLTTPSMIAAKTKGAPALPIMSHAAVHALLIFLCLLIAGATWELSSILAGIEFITHYHRQLKRTSDSTLPYPGRHAEETILAAIRTRSIASYNSNNLHLVFSNNKLII